MIRSNSLRFATLTLALIFSASHVYGAVVFTAVDDVDGVYNPTISGSSLSINPSNFDALASGNTMSMMTGTLNLTVAADAGYQITGVTFNETGDYTVAGGGAASAELSYTATANTGTTTGTSTFTAPTGTGVWPNSFNASFAAGTTTVDLSIVNKLSASGAGAADLGFIKKKASDGLFVHTAPIPEPSTAVLSLFGLLAVASLSRRGR